MNKTEELLTQFGLTPTEARIYLAGLEADVVSVQDIGTKTKIKRPTIYHAVGTLLEKGLIEEKKIRGKSRYSMTSPENLKALVELEREKLDSKAKDLEALLPLLLSQRAQGDKEETSVIHYSGVDGVKTVFDLAFYCKSKHWDIIAPVQNFLREYDPEYAQRYLNARKYYGITSRTLWEAAAGYRPISGEDLEARNPRIMPAEMHDRFKSMIILFDDKVAIFSSYTTLFAILITSKEIYSMFLAMYDGIWNNSMEYETYIKTLAEKN